jgi:P-type Mg2+ transporter
MASKNGFDFSIIEIMEVKQRTSFWSVETGELLSQLQTTNEGINQDEAEDRIRRYGPNVIRKRRSTDVITLIFGQFKSPLTLILVFAAILSFFLQQPVNGVIVISIVIVSAGLGFWQEYGAVNAVESLISIVQVKVAVKRAGKSIEVPLEEIVPGDIVLLKAGDIIPGDCLIIESHDLFADEAALTGETYPAEKAPGIVNATAPLKDRKNALFMGSHIVSGSATVVVVYTGLRTEFGKIAQRLELRRPETEFERGIRRFGILLSEITFVLVVAIFAINVFLSRPILDSFLFALALAVGLTPQLLPAIISINLAQGAKLMAKQKVIVKRLAAIENFGGMNILCSDKTGTLTEGNTQLDSTPDITGKANDLVVEYAFVNASLETGYANLIDKAILSGKKFDLAGYKKLDEIPYDFVRKRVSILALHGKDILCITKGAVLNVINTCTQVEMPDGSIHEIEKIKPELDKHFEDFSSQGYRALAVAYRKMEVQTITRADEKEMIFLGFLLFSDPIKEGMKTTLEELKNMGLSLKIITGDNRLVAQSIATQVGLNRGRVVTGAELSLVTEESLIPLVENNDIFAEVEPAHKEHIIRALMLKGNVVGFLGDGINDASALHVADVGISVNNAVDVAKEAADIVLLDKDIRVLAKGIKEGRKTFANTLKYIFMATSANFGNMFSMAGASLFLPFLPLLPGQILLTNLLTDLPEMTIATDSVDGELVQVPRRWNIGFIRKFMIVFGILSSVFDYITFGILLLVLHAGETLFRTGWFIESVISASLVVLVIRSRKFFFKSKPSPYLLMMTIAVAVIAMVFPFVPLGPIFKFDRPPLSFVLMMLGTVVLYIISAELMKRWFYRHAKF